MSISSNARIILEQGLAQAKRIELPRAYQAIAREVYAVPERPAGFAPRLHTPKPRHTAVLTTGGLDSTVAWLMTKEPKSAYYVDMGQAYATKELSALTSIGINPEVIKVAAPNLDAGWQHIHPGRNLYYLALVAERQPQPARLLLGATSGEMSLRGGDKSWRFLRLANRLLATNDPPVRVVTPLANMTKGDLVEWAVRHDYLDTITHTISCFSPLDTRCGLCQSCLRTWLAFRLHNVELKFDVHPMAGAIASVKKYQRVLRQALRNRDFSHYSERRCEQDLAVLGR